MEKETSEKRREYSRGECVNRLPLPKKPFNARVKMTNVEMPKCAVYEGFTRSLCFFFVATWAKRGD